MVNSNTVNSKFHQFEGNVTAMSNVEVSSNSNAYKDVYELQCRFM